MKVIIRNKETKIELEKDQIMEVLETADGIALNMKNGLSIIHVDGFMPSTAKQLIKSTLDHCQATHATIDVNLADHQRPASINVHEVAPPSEKPNR